MKQFGGLFLFFSLSVIIISAIPSEQKYSPGFYNHSDCLYIYQEGAEFQMLTKEGDLINKTATIEELTYEVNKTYCTEDDKPGRITFIYKLSGQSIIKAVQISMRIRRPTEEGFWKIDRANLTVYRHTGTKRTFPLFIEDIYAGRDFSYSCSKLNLKTLPIKKSDSNETSRTEPRCSIELKRFQIQPFGASAKAVFNESFDCSVWFTIPTLIGLILFLFMFLLVAIPVYCLLNIEPEDFKFVKEALHFTQFQLESSKKN